MSLDGLRAEDIRVQLGGRWVVDGVGLDAARGRVNAIVGPNGSGKTSLLRALAGLLPYQGRVLAEGTDLQPLSPAERAQRIAYLPQTSALQARLTVREVVALGLYAGRLGWFRARARDAQRIELALERAGIRELGEQTYPKLSGGQQRLVLIARALATGARTLLLDEPTASLDVRHGLELFELLASLAREGYCVIVVLHDLDDVQRHAEWAVLLDGGRLRAAGPPKSSEFVSAAEQTYQVRLIPSDRVGFRLARVRSEHDGSSA
jgi:iron complex transport system ATP-binding protein